MTGTIEPVDLAADAIRVSFTTNQAEQVAATRAILRTRPNWYAMSAFWGVVPTVLAIRAGLTEGLSSEVLVLGLIAVVGLAFWNYGVPWLSVRASRRGVHRPDGPFTWTLDPSGCRLEGPSVDVSLRWAAIVDTKETPESFLLYVSKMQAYNVPKRAVSDSDLPRLRDMLTRRAQAATAA